MHPTRFPLEMQLHSGPCFSKRHVRLFSDRLILRSKFGISGLSPEYPEICGMCIAEAEGMHAIGGFWQGLLSVIPGSPSSCRLEKTD